jgi:hypothetical protein
MSLAKRRFRIASTAALALCGLGSAAHAITAINLGTAITNSGAGTVTTSTPLGINSYDQVVGYYSTSAGQQPFVYTPGSGAATIPAGAAGFNNKAYGINDSGIVAGTYGGNGTTESFYYNVSSGASSFTQILPVADATSSTSYHGAFIEAQAINNNNVITGYSSVSNTSSPSSDRTFTYTVPGGTATDVSSSYSGTAIGQYGANSTFGDAINASGVIANYGPTPTSANSTTPDPFILTPVPGGGYTGTDLAPKILLADPAYTKGDNVFEGIDAAGNVVGDYYESPPTAYGFFYNASSQSVVQISDSLGTGSVKIYGINDVGSALTPEFVGSAVISGSTTHAFVDYGGSMYDLNTIDPVAGYTLNVAYAINGSGDIVATGTPTAGGSAQAFLLTSSPVPEPASLGLLGLGAMTLLGRRRARRIA